MRAKAVFSALEQSNTNQYESDLTDAPALTRSVSLVKAGVQ